MTDLSVARWLSGKGLIWKLCHRVAHRTSRQKAGSASEARSRRARKESCWSRIWELVEKRFWGETMSSWACEAEKQFSRRAIKSLS